MKETDIDELIDAYLKNRLSVEDQLIFNKYMDDPVFASRVKEAELTYRFLQYSRYKHLKKQLKEIDRNETPKGRLSTNLFISATIIFIACVFTWLYMVYHFSPQRLAEKYFIPIPQNKYEHQMTEEDEIILNQANQFFVSGDFQNAARLYNPYILSSHFYFNKETHWNVLMCRLAMEGPSDPWKAEAADLIHSLPGSFKRESEKLLTLLDSPFYRFIMMFRSSRFSTWRPRLM